jgi:RND family efflux transporter MFP subunit
VTTARPLVQKLTEWDEFTGRFEPVDRVELRPRVEGYLHSVHFEDGQLVEQGQLLFVIDPRPYEAAADRSRAQIAEAEARLQLAGLDQQRAEQLVTTSAVARATLDERNAELNTADATLAAAKAQLRQEELNLEFTRITAPIKGRISNRRVDVGNLVNPETMLTTVVALDPIYFNFDMSESDFVAYQRAVGRGELPSTRDNDTIVNIRLADEDGWPRTGRMNFVDNVVDRNTGTVRARAIVDNPDGFLTPGQFGIIRVPGSPEYNALLIPDGAIVTDQARKLVLTVSADGTVEPKEIRPGPREFGLRIVRRGLAPEDRIIINGVLRARPGSKVSPEDGQIERAETPPASGPTG